MSNNENNKKHKHCPFCGHHIDEENMICPHCGLFVPQNHIFNL